MFQYLLMRTISWLVVCMFFCSYTNQTLGTGAIKASSTILLFLYIKQMIILSLKCANWTSHESWSYPTKFGSYTGRFYILFFNKGKTRVVCHQIFKHNYSHYVTVHFFICKTMSTVVNAWTISCLHTVGHVNDNVWHG